jgi:hypothetical protein
MAIIQVLYNCEDTVSRIARPTQPAVSSPNLLGLDRDVAMGLSIYYRSTQPMHPALAFEIRQQAAELSGLYQWLKCEPPVLCQRTSGILCGASKLCLNADPAESESDADVPDGTLMTLAEVLSELSRCHPVDWELAHDYELDTVGTIAAGIADDELIEQLETLETIGDLWDEFDHDDSPPSPAGWLVQPATADRNRDHDQDDGPRLLKFPGAW